MKKYFKSVLKIRNKILIFKPNKNIRLSFYISKVEGGDNTEFTTQDLDNIMLLNTQTNIDSSLFEFKSSKLDEGIFGLMDEKVLKSRLTGADLDIYNYNSDRVFTHFVPTKLEPQTYFEPDCSFVSFGEEENDFAQCILADQDILTKDTSQIVHTFKGYLVLYNAEFSVLRQFGEQDLKEVYISRELIDKYQLRNGDQVLCACKKFEDRFIVSKLFAINQINCAKWDINRLWFSDIKPSKARQNLKIANSNWQKVDDKFGVFKGDNIYMYMAKTSQKVSVLENLMAFLSESFDKIVYINTEVKNIITFDEQYDICKFYTMITAGNKDKFLATLLGINYARRLMELGKNVAIIIDDIDSIIALDKNFDEQMPVSTTLLNTLKASKKGACTIFSLVPLRLRTIKSIELPNVLKLAETLAVMFSNNLIDIKNSYRI